MFAKTRKEKFVEQAQDLAHDLGEAIAPHVERARDEIAPRLADARDAVSPRLSNARDAVAPHAAVAKAVVAPRLADARDAVAPRLSEARDAVAPRLSDARDAVAPHAASARDRIVEAVGPTVSSVYGSAKESAVEAADEAKRRGVLATAALKGEPVKKKSGGKKWLLLAALAGAGAFAAKKLTGGSDADNWQSSYTPTPSAAPSSTTSPAAPPAPPSPSAPAGGADVADTQVDLGRIGTNDAAGATPGETVADSTEAPHPVTTPDDPAQSVDVSDKKDPGQA
ncbi:MAG: hypothetical protein JWR42_1053 [Marmoricola sp.]|nr:hypothetical protein [Marmoricola sp.]